MLLRAAGARWISVITDLPEILASSSKWIEYLKQNATESLPFEAGSGTTAPEAFASEGQSGSWRDVITAEDNKHHKSYAERELGAECAHWLATGERT